MQGGQLLAFYLVQNNTGAQFLDSNPTNSFRSAPLAFFSFPAANPDGVNHVQAIGDLRRPRLVLER